MEHLQRKWQAKAPSKSLSPEQERSLKQAMDMAPADPRSSVTKSRMAIEGALELLGRRKGTPRQGVETLDGYISRLRSAGIIDKEISDDADRVRLSGNKGAHGRSVSPVEAKRTAGLARKLVAALQNR